MNDEFMDWSAARREVADIEKLGDQDLDKLYDDIVSVRPRGYGHIWHAVIAQLTFR